MRMKKFKQVCIAVMVGCMLLTYAGCSSSTSAPASPVSAASTSTASAKDGRVEPVQSQYDASDLNNSSFAASFTADDVEQQNGQTTIHLTAYDSERFNASDIENLKVGDVLVIDQKEIKVESVEPQSDNWVQINGGLDQDGCDLCKDEDGFYSEMLLESKSYYSMAELSLPLAKDFIFRDSADPEKQEQEYDAEQFEDFMKDDIYGFYPNNTTMTVLNGEIFQITRIFTP